MNGTISMPIAQAAFPPPERSRRRKTSITARTHRKRKSTITAPRRIRMPGLYASGSRLSAVRLSARIVKLELAEPFVIARDTTEVAEVVWVELEHEAERGFGEAAPNDRYNESAESALDYVEAVAGDFGDDPFALEEIMARLPRREYAARAAIDAALHDLCGKLMGLPVWRMLGLRRAGPQTSWTIGLGDPDEMARKAENVTDFQGLKLKLGGRDGQDVERVRAVRAGWEGPIRGDVNEGWTALDVALDGPPRPAAPGVEYGEQPFPAGHAQGLELKERSPIPIYVDEDCHTLDDIADCARRGPGANIKLRKWGGLPEC